VFKCCYRHQSLKITASDKTEILNTFQFTNMKNGIMCCCHVVSKHRGAKWRDTMHVASCSASYKRKKKHWNNFVWNERVNFPLLNLQDTLLLIYITCFNIVAWKPLESIETNWVNHEEYRLLGCDALWLLYESTFRKNAATCFNSYLLLTLKNGVFWNVTQFRSCKNQCFGGT
jgi:hypothetical protein